MTRAFVVVAVIVALAGIARAGEFCQTSRRYYGDGPEGMMWALEHFARDPKAWRDAELAAWCLRDETNFKPRILAACTLILDRDPDWASCYVLAAAHGTATLGKHDVFAWVAARPRKPGDVDATLPSNPLALLAALGDRRGAALVVATWTAATIEATRRSSDRAWRRDWASWRVLAAAALAELGDKDTAAFLDAQAKVTPEPGVKKAIRTAADEARGPHAPKIPKPAVTVSDAE
jgi:hypothetical protein